MSTDSEEYDHDPDRFPLADEDGEQSDETGSGAGADSPPDQEFGTRGWVLVGAVLVSFLVVPLLILFRPPVVPFEVAFLVLPLLPGFLLGGAAVWALAGRD